VLAGIADVSMAAEAATSILENVGDGGGIQVGGDGGGEGLEGLEVLGPVALLASVAMLTAGGVRRLRRFWRERHLRPLRKEFQDKLEALFYRFVGDGHEKAFRTARLVIGAMELEVHRLEQLMRPPTRTGSREKSSSNRGRVARAVLRDTRELARRMLGKCDREISGLITSVQRYAERGRADLAGLHLWANRDLVFLPSQVPPDDFADIERCQLRMLAEIARLRRPGTARAG
jgi:hypothetical protein